MPQEPHVVSSVADLRAAVDGWRARGERSALVPTMGALHAGHLALVDRARTEADRVVVSVFVNPTQFAPGEDLEAYPRTFEADRALLAERQADLVYAPVSSDMYPAGFATTVSPGGPAGAGLEDRFRPHFFAGVATVVTKLFTRSRCDVAVFGEKDYQQLLVVRRLTADLDLPIRIVGAATVRDPDGLALSSRNRNLTSDERRRAATLPRMLRDTVAAVRGGADPAAACARGASELGRTGFEIDYLEIRDAATLGPARPGATRRLLAAVRLGATRLIDNMDV